MLERRSSHDDLIDHLVRSTALQRGEAARVILDVLAYFDENNAALIQADKEGFYERSVCVLKIPDLR